MVDSLFLIRLVVSCFLLGQGAVVLRGGNELPPRAALELAIHDAEVAGEPARQADLHLRLADLLRGAGDVVGARTELERAARRYEALGQSNDLAEILLRHARLENEVGRPELAVALANRAGETETRTLLPAISLETAWSAFLEGKLRDAKTGLEALVYDDSLDPTTRAMALSRLARVFIAEGDRSPAATALTRADRIPLVDPHARWLLLRDKVFIAGKTRDLDGATKAASDAEELLARAPEPGAAQWLSEARARMALRAFRISSARGDADGGEMLLAAQKAADAIMTSSAEGMIAAHDVGELSRLTILTEDQQELIAGVYEQSARYFPDKGFEDMLFEAVERMRAPGLREVFLLDADDRIARAVELRGEVFAAKAGSDARNRREARWAEALDALGEARRALAERPISEPSVTAKEIRAELLGPESLLLVYQIREDGSFLWEIDKVMVKRHNLPRREQIAPRVAQLVHMIRAPGREDLALRSKLCRELGSLLLGSLEGRWKGKRLILVKDGVLHDLPFALLRTAEGRLRDSPISLLPSATIGVLARRANPVKAASGALVLADPVVQPYDLRLSREAREKARAAVETTVDHRRKQRGSEARKVNVAVPSADVREGLAVDRDALDVDRLGKHDLLHLALPHTVEEDRPEGFQMIVSAFDSDGEQVDHRVPSSVLGPGSLSASLVAVTNPTAPAALGTGGPWHVGIPLMSAGARRVLVSLWPVDGETTAQLVSAFYGGIYAAGREPDEALRLARQIVRKQPGRSEPHYWAGFVLLGERDSRGIVTSD